MIRLFQVYYPVRMLVLLGGEALVVYSSFLLAARIQLGDDSYLVLGYENGFVRILLVTGIALFCAHAFDLYDLQHLSSRGETVVRLLVALGALCFVLATMSYAFPSFPLARNVFLLGVIILSAALFAWRTAYDWLIHQPCFCERVYVLGAGARAERLVNLLRTRRNLGMEVVGWTGAVANGSYNREALASNLMSLKKNPAVDHVIVAMSDRRGIMPVRELLDLRLSGTKVEDATSLLEKISGQIEIDELYPSWLIFSEGFRRKPVFLFVRRLISVLVALLLLLATLPLLPLIVLAIKLTSPGPVLYRQARVGANGVVFHCYKFRTMWRDAEADSGPTFAGDEDPRITPLGHFLRRARLDELPQLWNVLRGDMEFVGPRPERPEFVEWLGREIPYYRLRHVVRPGITGWAQVRYWYGASLEESKQKLKYDLYYIKHMSLMLDLLIVFETIKTVLVARGSR